MRWRRPLGPAAGLGHSVLTFTAQLPLENAPLPVTEEEKNKEADEQENKDDAAGHGAAGLLQGHGPTVQAATRTGRAAVRGGKSSITMTVPITVTHPMAPTSAPARLDLQLCSIPTLLTDTNLSWPADRPRLYQNRVPNIISQIKVCAPT